MSRISMKSAAQLTQLSEYTLRAWEKRYGVVSPKRISSGHRVYETSDIEKLTLLRKLVQSGEPIGSISALSISSLKKMLKEREQLPHAQGASVHALMELLEEFNLAGLQAQLRSFQLHFETKVFLTEIVAPFLNAVGVRVTAGKMDVFYEHGVSAIIRNQLSGIMYLTEQSLSPIAPVEMVFSTPEGDLHEFGILIGAILAMLKGKKVLYLGPNLPASSMAQACKISGASQVIFAVTSPEEVISSHSLAEFIQKLNNECHRSVEFTVGGARAQETKKLLGGASRKVQVFENLNAFEASISPKH